MSNQEHLTWVRNDLEQCVRQGFPPAGTLWRIMRYVAKWRSTTLGNAILQRNGTRILSGPFAGMDYLTSQTEGALAPRLLGSYERELHPFIERFAAEGHEAVVDIGCAEGYYAVGLALLMPKATIHAFDTDPAARTLCAELAAKNGVADRVRIGELFEGERFADFQPGTLVIVDIEGGELELLDPVRFPGLLNLNLIVETHPGAKPGSTEVISSRFAASHDITRVDQAIGAAPLPEWLVTSNHLDMLLATWEWRMDSTPWLVMTPKITELSLPKKKP
jgi:hypothetical protein